MTVDRGDCQPDSPNDTDEDLVRRGVEWLSSAKNDVERRNAIIVWLRGATSAVDEYLLPREGSPGTLLLAALEDLNNGTTPPLMQAARGGTRREIELSRARARAVAAVEIVLEFQRLNGVARSVRAAISAVSESCGLTYKQLDSLRHHVNAGKLYRPVAELLPEEKADLTRYVESSRLFGHDLFSALTNRLLPDRLLLTGA